MYNPSDDDAEVIREQMEETRNSLTEKLEALELQVTETASGAAAAVTDSVQSVKEAVQDTVDTVKDSVHETVETVKSTLDVAHQVRERPWTMLIGATVAGYVGGLVLEKLAESGGQASGCSEAPEQTLVAHKATNGANAGRPTTPARPSLFAKVKERYGEEITKLEGLALATICGLVRDNLAAAVNPEVGERLTEVIDNFTEKWGGKPIRGPVFSANPQGPLARETVPPDPVASERLKRRFGTTP